MRTWREPACFAVSTGEAFAGNAVSSVSLRYDRPVRTLVAPIALAALALWPDPARGQEDAPDQMGQMATGIAAEEAAEDLGLPPPGEEPTGEEGEAEAEDPDRFEWGALPYAAGNSDYGVLIGAIAVLASHERGVMPYAWRGQLALSVSVMQNKDGAYEVAQHFDSIRWDIPNLAGGRLRLLPQILFQRTINQGWFGLGNASSALIPPDVPSDDRQRYHQFIYTAPELRCNANVRLGENLSLMTGIHGRYVLLEPWHGSLVEQQMTMTAPDGSALLTGTGDHGLILAAAGIQWDARDDETVPTLGMLHELSLRAGIGFDERFQFAYGGVTAHARYYIPLAGQYLVLALRVLGDALFGAPPFYELGRAGAFFPVESPGGQDGIRGVPAGRYAGRVKLLASFELRSIFWDFTLFSKPMSLGAVVFFDGGRVWTGDGESSALDGYGPGLKYGAGGGIYFRWGETAIFRFETAWSPDAASTDPDFPIGVYVAFAQSF
jgi:hypothetical protein